MYKVINLSVDFIDYEIKSVKLPRIECYGKIIDINIE